MTTVLSDQNRAAGAVTADQVYYVGRGDETHVVRREVAEFALAMEAKLRKNDHKTGWQKQPIEAHIKLLRIEMMEFDVALEFLGDTEAARECVDIANFALIIRDKLLTRATNTAREPHKAGVDFPGWDPTVGGIL